MSLESQTEDRKYDIEKIFQEKMSKSSPNLAKVKSQ
jgi:hypothetical protein